MKTEDATAARFDAVSLSSMEQINRGTLISADEDSGVVVYENVPGSRKTVTLGQHAIKIIPRSKYGR